MKELSINENGWLSLDVMELPKNCLIVLSEGKAKCAELPEFAETKIITHQGKVKRLRWDVGEEF